jgi:ATP-dependent helicase HrpA
MEKTTPHRPGALRKRLEKLQRMLPQTLCRDHWPLSRAAARLKAQMARNPADPLLARQLADLEARLAASLAVCEQRARHRPEPRHNPDLPIFAHRDQIVAAIRRHPVTIIAGQTGSGKTTQIPKFCLAAGRGLQGQIGCTQPRRIAATSLARRLAEELGTAPGTVVGHKVRFQDNTRPEAYIKIMTDGILLAEAQGDRRLAAYDTLIVDEAHERSLNIDFVLGLLKTLLVQRPEFRLIVTSATIDTAKFSEFFDQAPVIEVSGRMFPVTVHYRPPDPDGAENGEATHIEQALGVIDGLQAGGAAGDILVFMPTEQDIRETCELLAARRYRDTLVLPLFARLPADQQARVFESAPGRKIIVATNVAETSLTIPGIRYVVDSGLARISHYSPRSRTTSLPVRPVSRSSCDQRMGRCGRVADGVCFRLYAEEDYLARPLFTAPEILRANLAEVVLRMMALKLGDVAEFPFIDPPVDASIRDGFNLLLELGAIRERGGGRPRPGRPRHDLTANGRMMAKIPIDPRLARMLLTARAEGCLEEITIIAAALSIQDPRERPPERAAEADRAHAAFKDPASDFITLLNIWRHFNGRAGERMGSAQLKKFCRERFLSFRRLREWRDLHGQLTAILEEHVLPGPQAPPAAGVGSAAAEPQGDFSARYGAIHRAILSGFLSNIALQKEGNLYTAARNRAAMIFPGSGLFNAAGKWIVAAELVETSRLFARTVAKIDPAWLEPLAREQCRYTYLEPHWERARGEVVAREEVTLYGLPIVSGRPVSYGRINPAAAAEIFLQRALVEGDVRTLPPFMVHNQALMASVRDLEDRVRRRDLLIGDAEVFQFYRDRLPGVSDWASLKRRIREAGGDDFLQMTRESLLRYLPDAGELAQYPDRVALGKGDYACDYSFAPGAPTDGVTVRIRAAQAPQVAPEALDWLVPGLLKDKIAALIRGLPKAYRRQLLPLARTVDIIANEMPRGRGALLTALGRFVRQRFGVDIPAAEWPRESLPEHLKMRIALTDAGGKEILAGRDPALLTREVAAAPQPEALAAARRSREKHGLSSWDFGDLPGVVPIRGSAGGCWEAFPALSAEPDGIHLRLFESRLQADAAHPDGVAALLREVLKKEFKLLQKSVALPPGLSDAARYFGGHQAVAAAIGQAVWDTLFRRDLRSREAFEAQLAAAGPRLQAAARDKLALVAPVLAAYQRVRETLCGLESSHAANAVVRAYLQGLRAAAAALVPENFLTRYPDARLAHLPRYLEALEIRARRGVDNLERDLLRARELQVFSERLDRFRGMLGPQDSSAKRAAVEEFGWMIEEFKVSLFAQELKTVVPVSPKRLDRLAREIDRMA